MEMFAITAVLLVCALQVQCGCVFHDNIDYPDNGDFDSPTVSTKEECCARCQDSPECTVATFNKNTGRCWLKAIADPDAAEQHRNSDGISAIVHRNVSSNASPLKSIPNPSTAAQHVNDHGVSAIVRGTEAEETVNTVEPPSTVLPEEGSEEEYVPPDHLGGKETAKCVDDCFIEVFVSSQNAMITDQMCKNFAAYKECASACPNGSEVWQFVVEQSPDLVAEMQQECS